MGIAWGSLPNCITSLEMNRDENYDRKHRVIRRLIRRAETETLLNSEYLQYRTT